MELDKTYDVVIIGAGPGGFATAVTAAREGASVLLVDANGYVGGQLGSGLPFLAFLDRKKRQCVGGIAQEFVDRLTELGGSQGHAYCPLHNSTTMIHPFLARIICFEMLKGAGVDVFLQSVLTDVEVRNRRIQSITVSGKGDEIQIRGKIYVDGTGDGDLAYCAGAGYEKGQKGTGIMQPPTLMFNLGGVNCDEFCDYIAEHPEDLPYGLKFNQLREGYNLEFFRHNRSFIFLGLNHLLAELRKKGECPIDRDTVIFICQPNPNEVAVNTIRITHFDGSNVLELSRGDEEAHLQILPLIEMFRKHVPGFENCFLTYINSSIGVRESRRIIGRKMLDHQDAIDGIVSEDSIGLCGYFLDIHNGNGGDTVGVPLENPFGIPYLCTVARDLDNLMMAGRDISVDAITFGASRIMNTCMVVGQAVGTAAAMAVKKGTDPADVDVAELRSELLKQKVILSV